MAKLSLRRIWCRIVPSLQLAAFFFLAVLVLKVIDSVRAGRVDVTFRGVIIAALSIIAFSVVVPFVLKPVLNFIARMRYRKKHN